MIPKECRRLAEVDFPIAVVSKHSARERSIRHEHPSKLHLWWARRPLAACRAILLGLLLPDPCDENCPDDFKKKARELLRKLPGKIAASDKDIQQALLRFIGDFADWDNAKNSTFVQVGRGLVKAAHAEEKPLVVDPFAGGGSIPLEALRLGCETFASDLNPVACLILKVMLDDIPRHRPELADELERVAAEVKKTAEEELAPYYPVDADGSRPIAYLWARTARCEAVGCGAEIPLVRSFLLCTNANRRRMLKPKTVRSTNGPPKVEFEIVRPKEGDEGKGTIADGKATCLCCTKVLAADRVRAQLSQIDARPIPLFGERGNRLGGARMLVVVTEKTGNQGRNYRLPSKQDYQAVFEAQKQLEEMVKTWEREGKIGLCPVPDELLSPLRPSANARGLSAVTRYGAKRFGDLFTGRQMLTIITLIRLIRDAKIPPLVLGKIIRHCNAFAFWHKGSETVAGAFGRHALPMSWDFPELYPLADFAGGLSDALDDLLSSVRHIANAVSNPGQVVAADATCLPLPDESAAVWFTDPPYYDAIPYADLSDFFFVWLKRAGPEIPLLRDQSDPRNPLTPKAAEVVQSQKDRDLLGRPKDRAFYEHAMAKAFSEGRRILREDGIGSVVFAHKTTEGWEALLSGMIRGGWTVTGSWPIATERGARLLARETAALGSSVHLICRKRQEDASIGDWNAILRELPKRVGDWMERLQGEGVRGADLVFACIGPALEIFSRYSRVETPEGNEVSLADYLEKVWEVVGRSALEQILGTAEAKARNGAAGALEEDARLTALFLWTLQSTKVERDSNGVDADDPEDDEEEEKPKKKKIGYPLVYDVVRRFAQPLGIRLPEWEDRIIKTDKGVVYLLFVNKRAEQLFGTDGAVAIASRLTRDAHGDAQLVLFPDRSEEIPQVKGRRRRAAAKLSSDSGTDSAVTTLDRVHAAMLLQANGQANGLRALINSEQERGPDFLRLANALSALYPKNSEEKRLLDAMLLAVPR